MRLHAYLPCETADADPNDAADLAVLAEELGYEGVWLPDHPLPYYEFGGFFGGVFEPLVMLANIAARTTRVTLGTGAIIPAMRNPFVVAKQVATLDCLSNGRLSLGIGIGIVKQEFENLGADFSTRGARTDEIIRLFRHLFEVRRGPFDGRYYPLGDAAVFEPRPTQGADIPVWIGGRTEAAWRRAARLGDGWLCAMTEPGDFAESVKKMRDLAERPVKAGARIQWEDPEPTVDQAIEHLETWQAIGTDDLFLWLGDPAGYRRRMELFAEAGQRVLDPVTVG
jgi:probable F420-dependent oxidoreductase